MTKDYGVYPTGWLYSQGFTPGRLRAEVSSGKLRHVSRGWYAIADADPDVVLAIKHGGRVGCLTGCRKHGIWVPPTFGKRPHVLITERNAAPKAASFEFHRTTCLPNGQLFSVEDCVQQAMHHHDAETGLIVLESAINKRAITFAEAQYMAQHVQEKKKPAYRFLDMRSESGSETRVRLFLQLRGVNVRPQRRTGTGWVDLIAGNSWIIECDGREYHDTASSFENDRRRDLGNTADGFFTTRLSYRQIWHEWELTKQYLHAILHKRRHRLASHPGTYFGENSGLRISL